MYAVTPGMAVQLTINAGWVDSDGAGNWYSKGVAVTPVTLAHSVLVVAVPDEVPVQDGVDWVTVTIKFELGVKPVIVKVLDVTLACEPVPAPLQLTVYWPTPYGLNWIVAEVDVTLVKVTVGVTDVDTTAVVDAMSKQADACARLRTYVVAVMLVSVNVEAALAGPALVHGPFGFDAVCHCRLPAAPVTVNSCD